MEGADRKDSDAVTSTLELSPPYDTKQLSWPEISMLQEATLRRLSEIDLLLRYVFSVKVVVNQRRNFLNIRIQRHLLATVFVSRQTSLTVFFVLSDKLQRFATVRPFSERGELKGQDYTETVASQLEEACREFKKSFGIGGETYQVLGPSATPCDSFRGALSCARSFPQVVQLQMRVATQMYHERLPILKMFNSEKVRALIGIAEGTSTQKRDKLTEIEPFLKNTLDFLPGENVAFKANFLTSVFQCRKVDTCFEFHLSDKIEPYVIIIAFDPLSNGNLVSLSPDQLVGLEQAITEFSAAFKISEALLFHYTTKSERFETDAFSTNTVKGTKAHSTVFHLKMKISTEFYVRHFPILRWLPMDAMMGLDTVKYNFSRETMPWKDVLPLLHKDCIPPVENALAPAVMPHQNKKRKMKLPTN